MRGQALGVETDKSVHSQRSSDTGRVATSPEPAFFPLKESCAALLWAEETPRQSMQPVYSNFRETDFRM
ncbi:hypothetical protein SIAM614_05583 [Stappia aggregata IAM 12614]|uniref:Uncharacterized protein n=1 Tax=Roseibium aggregatum (strain ATCC 25650 / DSM 13394 / JCM 20685 / NBRC 16684 / NCIMB 2208 / IAM 12614 / B1) TaxID=384765 RepID=A0NUW2_ROSAI|nr:hypothetical protein SIAM614_05583 [Stappia aggregata IAM 12614] [Roseibium aggregatum IAM 12614]